MNFLFILLLSYLIGSFPTSIVVGKLFFKKDIREYGSGNAGGTNTVRVFGWAAGVPVILIDIAKGAAAVLWISQIRIFDTGSADLFSAAAVAFAAGAAAVCGHIWSVFAVFRGGKGVATAAGMIAALYPIGFGAALIVFAAVVALTGIVSAASIAAAVLFPVILLVVDGAGVSQVPPLLLWMSIPIALLILFTHRKNIGRLLRGEEKRLFKKK
jgi:acyl phosphate:glycerol-3-phosphate acyltransferase